MFSRRRLLIIGVTFYIFSLECLAQPTSPTPPDSNGALPELMRLVTDNKEQLILVTISGLVVTVFVIRRVGKGIFSYHVNQFRVYFIVGDCDVTSAILSKKLEDSFNKIFKKGQLAEADEHSEGGPGLIEFRARHLLASTFGKVDIVVKEPRAGDAVFHVRTLGKDAARTEEVRGKSVITAEKLLKSSPRKPLYKRAVNRFKKIVALDFLNQHFLTGVRSWCIIQATDCKKYGEPVPRRDNSFFLETAAFERYSSLPYWFIPRNAIKETWYGFLYNALEELDKSIRPDSCTVSDNLEKHKLNDQGWEREAWPKKAADDSIIEIWQRDVKFKKNALKSLSDPEGYGPRLFSLHPGIKEEYLNAPK